MNGFCPKRRKGFKIRFCVGNCTECKTYCNKCWCMCIITPQEKFRGTIHTTHTLSFDINLAQRENNFSVLKYKYYIKIKWTNLSFLPQNLDLQSFGQSILGHVIYILSFESMSNQNRIFHKCLMGNIRVLMMQVIKHHRA